MGVMARSRAVVWRQKKIKILTIEGAFSISRKRCTRLENVVIQTGYEAKYLDDKEWRPTLARIKHFTLGGLCLFWVVQNKHSNSPCRVNHGKWWFHPSYVLYSLVKTKVMSRISSSNFCSNMSPSKFGCLNKSTTALKEKSEYVPPLPSAFYECFL